MAAVRGKKRTLQIVKVDNTALYAVKFDGGGALPDALDGHMWTSPVLAEEAIEQYESSQES